MNKYTVYKLLSVGMGLLFLAFSSFASASPSTCFVPGELTNYNVPLHVHLSNAINTTTYIPFATILIPKGIAQCEGGATGKLTAESFRMDGQSMLSNNDGLAWDTLINAKATIIIGRNGSCTNSSAYTQVNSTNTNNEEITLCLKITSLSTPPTSVFGSLNGTKAYVALTNMDGGHNLPDQTHAIAITFQDISIDVPYVCWNAGDSNITLAPAFASDYIGKAGEMVGAKTTAPLSFSCNAASWESLSVAIAITTGTSAGDDILTSNHDIAVRIFDKDGNIIPPDGRKFTVTMPVPTTGNGISTMEIPLSFASVSVTGNRPAPGSYQAIATVSLYFP